MKAPRYVIQNPEYRANEVPGFPHAAQYHLLGHEVGVALADGRLAELVKWAYEEGLFG